MKTIGEIIREAREGKGLLLREVAERLHVDVSFLSKIERGNKRPTKKQIHILSSIIKVPERELMLAFLSDKLVYEIKDEALASEALKVAEQKIEYLKKSPRLF